MLKRLGLGVGIGVLWLVGCGGGASGGGGGIANQTLTGKIGGQAWTFATGETDSFLSTDKYFTTLYPKAFTACDFGAAPFDENHFIIGLPKKVGAFDLSLAMNATFYEAATTSNRIVTSGHGEVESITATTITGGIRATLNAGNTIDGRFEATICP